MALTLTSAANNALKQINIEPQIVLTIDGVDTVYGARIIYKRVKIGDTDLLIDGSWTIGGLAEREDQSPLISLSDGTTTSIRQQLQPDKGAGGSITSMQIALIDVDLEASRLVSPGVVIDDVLGARCKVYLGFKDVAFPDDYVVIFRGIVDAVDTRPGVVLLNLSHPDQKKRQSLFPKATCTTIASFTLSCTTSSGGTNVTTASTAKLKAGMSITGTGIQANTTISSVTNGTTFVISQNATASATNTLTISGVSYDNTFILVDDPSAFFYQNKNAEDENGLGTFIKLDDEWIELWSRYESSQFFYAARAKLGTAAANHVNADAQVKYRLKGNVMDLALQLMLSFESGVTAYGSYLTEYPVTSFVFINSDESKPNSIFFYGVDLVTEYGVRIGDSVVTDDMIEAENYIALSNVATISEIEVRDDGTVLTVTGTDIGLVEEQNSTANIWITSQYNVLGTGLGMKPDEVDIDEHERLKRLFLSSFEVELYVDDSANIKELIEKELYAPAGAYSLPRKGKASVGIHTAPVPGTNTKIISKNEIRDPSKITLRRSLANNFANTIVYKYDFDFDTDEFDSGVVSQDATSISRIPVGSRAMVFESKGMRSTLAASTLATTAATRRLNRYKYGAEYIENLRVNFKTGFAIEIGDVVLIDPTDLQILNSSAGTREGTPRFFEVINKQLDIKTGDVVFAVVDTNYSTASRYGLVSPSSIVKTGVSQTEFIIQPSYNTSIYGSDEGAKWRRFLVNGGVLAVKVKSTNGTTRFGQSLVSSISGNVVTVATALGFTPQAGDIMELSDYDFTGVSDTIKKLYAHMRDSAFGDGNAQYKML